MRFILLLISVFFVNAMQAQLSAEDRRATAHMEPFAIKVTAAKTKPIQALQGPNLVLIDVRTAEEAAVGKIKGAIQIDYKAPDFKEKVAALDKTKQYLLYCYAGGLAERAMKTMQEMGFKQLYCMTDGYRAYAPVEDTTK